MDKYHKLEYLELTLTPQRFHVLTDLNHCCYMALDSIRTSLLKRISEAQTENFLSQDRILLADLSPRGHLWRSPESIYPRMYSEQCCTLDSDSARIAKPIPDREHQFAFINGWNFIEHIRAIRRLLIRTGRLLCHFFMIDWLGRTRHCLFKKLSVAIGERLQSQRIHGR